eukprot:m.929806 g.929806  ORF g.929806 m.929806 type:complete len:136 (+) comp23782_c0_seq14:93-500(+)
MGDLPQKQRRKKPGSSGSGKVAKSKARRSSSSTTPSKNAGKKGKKSSSGNKTDAATKENSKGDEAELTASKGPQDSVSLTTNTRVVDEKPDTLRWEHALDNEDEESKRIEEYKACRRQRYAEYWRQLVDSKSNEL